MYKPTAILTLALTLPLLATTASAVSCGDFITTNTRLTADLENCPGPALRVHSTSSVVIDLGGFHVSSLASAEATIEVFGSTNVRILGGRVSAAQTAIAVSNSSSVQLENLQIEDSSTGLYIWNSSNSEVFYSEFADNDQSIVVSSDDGSGNTQIASNNFYDNNGGVLIQRSHRNVVQNNTFRRNVGAVNLASSASNRIERNGIFDGHVGVNISNREPGGSGSHDNAITGNKIYDNDHGLVMQAPKTDRGLSKYNEIIDNAFRGGISGVEIVGPKAYKTQVRDNSFYGTSGLPIQDTGTRTIVSGNRCTAGC